MADDITVTVQEEGLVNASTDLANPVFLETLDSVGDVDMSTNGKLNGSVLVYKTTTSKWTATTVLDAQDVTGGQY
jgi:hypothetical protein